MPKILVIEDAEPLRNDIMEMLTFEKFEVKGAENGLVGVQVAREYLPDLIICDIMMPEMNGYDVLNELRKEEQTLAIPFIFLTAKTDRIDVRKGMGLGADDYLTKPFVAEQLLDTIQARLEHRDRLSGMIEQRMNELSNNIITALPHELRTPLNTIIGFSDMLIAEAQRVKPDQIAEWAKHINLSAQRLYRMVENYLMYVKLEVTARNEMEVKALRAKVLDHPEPIIQFHAIHKAQQRDREADLILNTNGDAKVAITDHDLGKIIEELVDNGLKFSEKGQPVTIETRQVDDEYIICIADQGRGMSQEQIDDVGALIQFDRWFYEQQGSGLGLTIVKRIVELYRGDFHIESVVDEKTIVTIKLHLAE